MASPGLALTRFTNLDQEFAPEYSNALVGPTSENSAAGTTSQPTSTSLPHDTVTLSNAVPLSEPYQTTGTSTATSLASISTFPPVRSKTAFPASTTGNPESPQSPAQTRAELAASSTLKAPPKPTAPPPPRESEAAQDDSYQPTTQSTQRSLLQLDRTLQQIGVDPQHTSLVRRVALVRLANDPPALGEYFGPPSIVAAATASSPAEARPPATESASSKSTPDTPKPSADAPHRSFVPQGKLLNVSA